MARKLSPSAAARGRRESRRAASGNDQPVNPEGSALPTSNPLLYADLTQAEIRAGERNMREAARGLVGKTVGSHGAVVSRVGGARSMTTDAIAGRFSRLIDIAEQDALDHHQRTGEMVLPAGTPWYPNHHQKYEDISADTGVPLDRAIASGATISPQNDPERTELPAARRMAEFVANPDKEVVVSPEASLHIHQIQTKANAHDKKRQKDPTAVPATTTEPDSPPHKVGELSPHAVALLGSVSGARYHPTRTAHLDEEAVREIGLNPDELTPSQEVHTNLADFRPLGSVRNRRNVEKAVEITRGLKRWDTLHPEPLDQPGKVTSYAITTNAATKTAAINEQHNVLTHLYGEAGMQYRLPWGETKTSAQDFWQGEAALDVEYETGSGQENPGKPAAAVWDSAVKKTGTGPDLTKDNVKHAILNEAQGRSLIGRPYTRSAGQAIVWRGERDPKTTGERGAPEAPLPEALDVFHAERAKVNTPPRQDLFQAAIATRRIAREVSGVPDELSGTVSSAEVAKTFNTMRPPERKSEPEGPVIHRGQGTLF